ncbi:MAG: hypothetical protein ACK4KT_02070 [Thermaurantimonas sp.]
MEMRFKTSLKCQGCVDQVAEDLTNTFGEKHWNVDLNANPKILIINDDREELAIEILQKKGYTAERIS